MIDAGPGSSTILNADPELSDMKFRVSGAVPIFSITNCLSASITPVKESVAGFTANLLKVGAFAAVRTLSAIAASAYASTTNPTIPTGAIFRFNVFPQPGALAPEG